VKRSDALTDDELQVSAAALIGLQNLTGSGQPSAATRSISALGTIRTVAADCKVPIAVVLTEHL